MVGKIVLLKPAFGFIRAENYVGDDFHVRPNDAKGWYALHVGDWVRFTDDRTERGLVARKVELLPDNRPCKPVSGHLIKIKPGYAFLKVDGVRLRDRELLGRQVFAHIGQFSSYLCEKDIGRQLTADIAPCERGLEAIRIELD